MLRETWVEPTRLFDVRSEAPPADALDVVFSVPTSVSLFADAVDQTPHLTHLLDRMATVFEEIAVLTTVDIQRACGYVPHPSFGDRTPARLALAGLAENSFHGSPSPESIPRIHAHIWVA